MLNNVESRWKTVSMFIQRWTMLKLNVECWNVPSFNVKTRKYILKLKFKIWNVFRIIRDRLKHDSLVIVRYHPGCPTIVSVCSFSVALPEVHYLCLQLQISKSSPASTFVEYYHHQTYRPILHPTLRHSLVEVHYFTSITISFSEVAHRFVPLLFSIHILFLLATLHQMNEVY